MEITKEMEAMAKLLNSGASITFSCCQIVIGNNAEEGYCTRINNTGSTER